MRNVKFDYRAVRARREDLGYPRWLLAREARISLSHLTNIEHGDALPGLQVVMRLAAALRVHPGKLFTDVDDGMSAVTDRVTASDVRVIARLLAAVRQRVSDKSDDRDQDDRDEHD